MSKSAKGSFECEGFGLLVGGLTRANSSSMFVEFWGFGWGVCLNKSKISSFFDFDIEVGGGKPKLEDAPDGWGTPKPLKFDR